MRNKFLEVFFGLDDHEAERQVTQFHEILKFKVNGIEFTQKATQNIIKHIDELNTKIEEQEALIHKLLEQQKTVAE